MEPHVQKTFDDFDAKIADHQREIIKLQQAANTLCGVYGLEPRYNIAEGESGIPATAKSSTALKPDEFFGKPLATAARMALTILRNSNKAPATAADIYDIMVQGGFEFPTKVREHALTGLGVSLAKNTDTFVKLPNGLIGLREWYGTVAPRAKRKDTNGAGTERAGDDQQVEPGDASGQGDDQQGAKS